MLDRNSLARGYQLELVSGLGIAAYAISWINFGLKSTLSDIKIAILAYFWFLFSWKTIFHPFTLKWYLSLMVRCFSWMQQKDGSCFLIQSVDFCLLYSGIQIINIENYKWAVFVDPCTLLLECALPPYLQFWDMLSLVSSWEELISSERIFLSVPSVELDW